MVLMPQPYVDAYDGINKAENSITIMMTPQGEPFNHAISKELAQKGIEPYINTLTNNTELRHSCEIIISSSSALEVLEKVSNSGEIFSARLFDYLSTKYVATLKNIWLW